MTYGASQMLLLLKPTYSLSFPTKSLIDAFWVLETNRAILYGDETVLSSNICPLDSSGDNWPGYMAEIVALMVEASSFARR